MGGAALIDSMFMPFVSVCVCVIAWVKVEVCGCDCMDEDGSVCAGWP